MYPFWYLVRGSGFRPYFSFSLCTLCEQSLELYHLFLGPSPRQRINDMYRNLKPQDWGRPHQKSILLRQRWEATEVEAKVLTIAGGSAESRACWNPSTRFSLSEEMVCYSTSLVGKLSFLTATILAKFTKPGRTGVGRGLEVSLIHAKAFGHDWAGSECLPAPFALTAVPFSAQLFPKKSHQFFHQLLSLKLWLIRQNLF